MACLEPSSYVMYARPQKNMFRRQLFKCNARHKLAGKSLGTWIVLLSMLCLVKLPRVTSKPVPSVTTAEKIQGHSLLWQAAVAPGGSLVLDSRPPGHGLESASIEHALEYEGVRGAPFDWLFLGAAGLARAADAVGWRSEVIHRDPDGRFVARLRRAGEG